MCSPSNPFSLPNMYLPSLVLLLATSSTYSPSFMLTISVSSISAFLTLTSTNLYSSIASNVSVFPTNLLALSMPKNSLVSGFEYLPSFLALYTASCSLWLYPISSTACSSAPILGLLSNTLLKTLSHFVITNNLLY